MNNANNASLARRNQQRIRRFVFTINNPTDSEILSLSGCGFTYLTYGKEHFDNPGATPHLQGCAVIGRQVAFSTLKKIPGFERAHIEAMKGTLEQAIAYCHKEDTKPYVLGEPPCPGKRNDILSTVQKLKEGKTLKQLCNEDDDAAVVFVKYSRGLTLLQSNLTPSRTEPPRIIWIYGPTGIGKTRSAVEFCTVRSLEFWMSNDSLQWFDGYSRQPVVIIDDYRTSFCRFNFLLRLLDRYPLSVPFKGGYAIWNPEYIFITSPKNPSDTWNLRTPEDLQQLDRRVSLSVTGEDHESITRRIYEFLADPVVDEQPTGLLGVAQPITLDDSDSDAEEEDSYADEYYFSLDK